MDYIEQALRTALETAAYAFSAAYRKYDKDVMHFAEERIDRIERLLSKRQAQLNDRLYKKNVQSGARIVETNEYWSGDWVRYENVWSNGTHTYRWVQDI